MPKAPQQGFTLIELSIVLVIIGLIVGGIGTFISRVIHGTKQRSRYRRRDVCSLAPSAGSNPTAFQAVSF